MPMPAAWRSLRATSSLISSGNCEHPAGIVAATHAQVVADSVTTLENTVFGIHNKLFGIEDYVLHKMRRHARGSASSAGCGPQCRAACHGCRELCAPTSSHCQGRTSRPSRTALVRAGSSAAAKQRPRSQSGWSCPHQRRSEIDFVLVLEFAIPWRRSSAHADQSMRVKMTKQRIKPWETLAELGVAEKKARSAMPPSP